jgi:hypothetical protein
MKRFNALSNEFQKATALIQSMPPGRPTAPPPLATNPFQDYFSRIQNRQYQYFEAPDTQTYVAELDKTLALFVQGLPAALEDDCKRGRTFPAKAGYTIDLPGRLKMFATDGEYFFNKPGQPVSGKISYQDLRQSAGIKSLLRLAKEANVDISLKFYFESGSARMADIREGTGKLHGMASPAIAVQFNFSLPYDVSKYPDTRKTTKRASPKP